MKIFRSLSDYQKWRGSEESPIGFVATMGALHEGHASLLYTSKSQGLKTVLSIFVNPTQFGPNEDFAKYPRTEENDLRLAAESGVDAVFLPAVLDVYPENYSSFVEETALSKPLCGQYRPGHFRGVTTVVYRLFQMIRPNIAFFGLKDLQQYLVLRKMSDDLMLPVKLVGVPTLREADGLAMSSRNRYLSPQDRKNAALIYANLVALRDGRTSMDGARQQLERAGFKIQYLEERGLKTLGLELGPEEPSSIFFAGFLNQTRLIDNLIRKELQ